MAYASIAGRARTNPRSPEAHGICDRCGFRYNLKDLVWQHEYRGSALTDIRLRVCTVTCLDVPFEFNRPLYLPPDPPPVDQPRTEPFAVDEGAAGQPADWDQANTFWDETGEQWLP